MTAVEYYNQEIKELFNMHQDGEISGNMFHVQRLVALTKAKEMEKQQIIDACRYGNNFEQGDLNCAIYYEKTYKNTKE
jgi:hypothetical protein